MILMWCGLVHVDVKIESFYCLICPLLYSIKCNCFSFMHTTQFDGHTSLCQSVRVFITQIGILLMVFLWVGSGQPLIYVLVLVCVCACGQIICLTFNVSTLINEINTSINSLREWVSVFAHRVCETVNEWKLQISDNKTSACCERISEQMNEFVIWPRYTHSQYALCWLSAFHWKTLHTYREFRRNN